MRYVFVKRVTVICALVATFLTLRCGHFAQKPVFGTIVSCEGTVEYFDAKHGRWTALKPAAPVHAEDSLRTLTGSSLEITFDDSSTLKLADSTTACIHDTADSQGHRSITVFNAGGEVMSELKGLREKGVLYAVKTPTALANSEGTHFLVFFAPVPCVTHVKVLDGRVRVFNPFLPPAPPVILLPGFYTTVALHVNPVAPVPLNYGQFKKMQRVLGPGRYALYTKHFGIKHTMKAGAPIVPFGARMAPGRPGPLMLKGKGALPGAKTRANLKGGPIRPGHVLTPAKHSKAGQRGAVKNGKGKKGGKKK